MAASASAQTPAASPAFEVSTVKVNNTGANGNHSHMNDGIFTATNISVKNLIMYSAYGIPDPLVDGGPKWLSSARFDIQAKMDSATYEKAKTLPDDQRTQFSQALFQQLLADRFKMTSHWETREMPVFALVVAKGGSKLQASKENGASTNSHNTDFTARGVTLVDLSSSLTAMLYRDLGRVVVDQTGLAGRYDCALKWTPDGAPPSGDVDAPPPIFTAIQEQLGLKLESSKAPVKVLVIDHLEMPAEN